MRVSKEFDNLIGCESDAVVRWARRGSAPCRKARPGVLFMELKGWWSNAERRKRKSRPRFTTKPAETINRKNTL